MLSMKATKQLREVVTEWAVERGLSLTDVAILLERIAEEVAGNKSFRDTIEALQRLIPNPEKS